MFLNELWEIKIQVVSVSYCCITNHPATWWLKLITVWHFSLLCGFIVVSLLVLLGFTHMAIFIWKVSWWTGSFGTAGVGLFFHVAFLFGLLHDIVVLEFQEDEGGSCKPSGTSTISLLPYSVRQCKSQGQLRFEDWGIKEPQGHKILLLSFSIYRIASYRGENS